jgi:acyl-CoA synthetase (NDP forming)
MSAILNLFLTIFNYSEVLPTNMHSIIKQASDEGRNFLTELESKEILGQVGITVNDTRLTRSKAEAVIIAGQLGFPVVLKINSPDIVHKSDAGGIKLDLQTAEQVEAAYDEIMSSCTSKHPQADIHGVSVQQAIPPGTELIIGMFRDPQFGPVLLFGLGGVWTEVLEDTSLRITPIIRKDAREMIEETKVCRLLTGYRGQEPADIGKIEDMLLALSDLVENNPLIKEVDINPVIASGKNIVAVDGRIVLEKQNKNA